MQVSALTKPGVLPIVSTMVGLLSALLLMFGLAHPSKAPAKSKTNNIAINFLLFKNSISIFNEPLS